MAVRIIKLLSCYVTKTVRYCMQKFSFFRLSLVLCNLSPIFIIMAIKWINGAWSVYYRTFCILMVVIPPLVIALRIVGAKRTEIPMIIKTGRLENPIGFSGGYLLAQLMVIAFYGFFPNEVIPYIILLTVFTIVWIWYIDFNRFNILFALAGYGIYRMYVDNDSQQHGKGYFMLITDRTFEYPETIYDISARWLFDKYYYEDRHNKALKT